MKRLLLAALLFAVSASSFAADSPAREKSLRRLDAVFEHELFAPATADGLKALMEIVHIHYPGVPQDTWDQLEPELAHAAFAQFVGDGGPLHEAMRAATRDMSDADLDRASRLLGDPALLRLFETAGRPELGEEFAKRLQERRPQMMDAVDAVLRRHGIAAVAQ